MRKREAHELGMKITDCILLETVFEPSQTTAVKWWVCGCVRGWVGVDLGDFTRGEFTHPPFDTELHRTVWNRTVPYAVP